MIRTILLDAVGTLIYPRPSAPLVYHQFGAQFGSRLSREQIAARFPQIIRDEFTSHTGDDGATSEADQRQRWQRVVGRVLDDVPDAGGELFDSLWQHFARATSWSLFDDVAAAWDNLQERVETVGIASNFDQRLPAICRELPPLASADHVFTSAAIGFNKPSRRFFSTIARRLNLSPQEILFIGDDLENDFLAARRAGFRARWLDRTHRRRGPLVIHSLAAVDGRP